MRAPSHSVLSRRASLLALGGISVDAVTPHPLAAKKKANFRCKKQVGACEDSVARLCVGPTCPAAADCCGLLADCNFTGFATCVSDAIAVPDGG